MRAQYGEDFSSICFHNEENHQNLFSANNTSMDNSCKDNEYVSMIPCLLVYIYTDVKFQDCQKNN